MPARMKQAPALRSRLALRRSTAAFSILGAPLPNRHLRRCGVRDDDPGRRCAPGGRSKDSRDRGQRNRGRRRRSPSTLSFARPSAPLWMGMIPTYSESKNQSRYFSLSFRGAGVSPESITPALEYGFRVCRCAAPRNDSKTAPAKTPMAGTSPAITKGKRRFESLTASGPQAGARSPRADRASCT
jgi:hypothetical protein